MTTDMKSLLISIAVIFPQGKKKNSFDPMTVTFNAGAEYRMPFYDRMSIGLPGVPIHPKGKRS